MYNERGNKPVAAQLVAGKLEKVRNFEAPSIAAELEGHPRFSEALWFLQWVSHSENYPGGIFKFTDDLIEESQELIGPEEVLKIGKVKKYTTDQIARIEKESYDLRRDVDPDEPQAKSHVESYAESLEFCTNKAYDHLSTYLFSLCEECGTKFTRENVNPYEPYTEQSAPWYFPRVGEAILNFMDRRKVRIAATIGETEITLEVSKWLEIARCAKRSVLIIGTERFGKTESVKNWCLQNPGLARIVQTPSSNAEADLLREVAMALGIPAGPSSSGYKMREMIDYVLTHSGLMLVFDECQFLLPGSYSRSTAAGRLNWFRRSIMDKGIASALVATPQSYKPAKDRFVKKTGYAIGQFDERILKTVNLPNELAAKDLLSIARIHFPTLAENYLEYVVVKTVATERNYVSDIEKIATLSRVSAQQAGRKVPTLADIKSAIADVLPAFEAAKLIDDQVPHTKAIKRQPSPLLELPATDRTKPFSSHNRHQTPAELVG